MSAAEKPVHEHKRSRKPSSIQGRIYCTCGEFFDPTTGKGAYWAFEKHLWSTRPEVTGRVLPTEELTSLIGEGMHAGLRKGTEASDAHDLWVAIRESKTRAWSDAAAYLAWSLESMGYKVVKVQ